MPVIRTQDKIKDLEDGDTLIVICTDPGTLSDIPAWCRIHGHTVIDTRQKEREQTFTIEVHK
jgi:tRNA 2-thiouridine synthesizing protein A